LRRLSRREIVRDEPHDGWWRGKGVAEKTAFELDSCFDCAEEVSNGEDEKGEEEKGEEEKGEEEKGVEEKGEEEKGEEEKEEATYSNVEFVRTGIAH
jgi:hypothetical protein